MTKQFNVGDKVEIFKHPMIDYAVAKVTSVFSDSCAVELESGQRLHANNGHLTHVATEPETPGTATPQAHIGAIVFIEYGRCCGLPALIGKGRITEETFKRGMTYVLVEPIEGMPLPKWVTVNGIRGYEWPTVSAANANGTETPAA